MGRVGLTRRGCGGWVLLEVMAATALLAVLAGSLAVALAAVAGRADAVSAGVAARGSTAQAVRDGWEWSGAWVEAFWTLGPTLSIRSACREGCASSQVGVWIDGWPVMEGPAGEMGRPVLGPAEWLRHAGAEVIIRARCDGGAWGPPWRTLVPGTGGSLPPTGEGPVPPAIQAGNAPPGAAEAVVHLPMAGNPAVEGLYETAVEATPSGLSFRAAGPLTGVMGVRLSSQEQLWPVEAGRILDVYF